MTTSTDPQDLNDLQRNHNSLWSTYSQIFARDWGKYSVTIAITVLAALALGLMTATTLVVLPLTTSLLAIGVVAHLKRSHQLDVATTALSNAKQKIANEASASRILDGIKILRGSDSQSEDSRLANAARMATEYPAAVVFNLRDAHGVLAPSNWSYEGQLSHIRDHFEPVDGGDPGAIAARQGSAIVISNTGDGTERLPEWAEQAGFTQGIVAPVLKGMDTTGVVYVLNKSSQLPSLTEIEQLELIISFSTSAATNGPTDSPVVTNRPFRVIEKTSSAVESQRNISPIRMTGFALNPESERLELDGTLISLSPTEFSLIHTLASSPDRPITPEELMDRCWSNDARPADNAVDVAIFRLRKKLNKTTSGKGLIKTVRGAGYMFIPPSTDQQKSVVAD